MKSKKRVNKKILISLLLLIFTLVSLIVTIFLLHKKEVEKQKELEELNKKYPLKELDFKEGLLESYTLLNCDISNDTLTFYLSDIKKDSYNELCKNLNNLMNNFKNNKENCNQKIAIFYIYDNNVIDYTKEKEISKIEYNIYDSYYYITSNQEIPNIESSNGLLPFEFISYDGKTLKVSMDLSSLSLYEKIEQIKTLYNITLSMNDNISELIIDIEDKNIDYIYNNKNEITIIEKINL